MTALHVHTVEAKPLPYTAGFDAGAAPQIPTLSMPEAIRRLTESNKILDSDPEGVERIWMAPRAVASHKFSDEA